MLVKILNFQGASPLLDVGSFSYLDKDEFVNGNYDDKNVFKLLGRGVKDIIEEELYTEKMVDFINGFENVGICFEEAGGVIEE